MIKILVVDDHAVVREGLKQILLNNPQFEVVEEASTGMEALRKFHSGSIDVMILDLNLPDRNGLEILKQVREEDPNLPVLILTMHEEGQYAQRLLKAGANGFLNKESAPEQLIDAVETVASGRSYVSPTLASQIAMGLNGRSNPASHETLSDREFEVLRMLGAGHSNHLIAKKLFLSEKTITTYRTRILQKMKLKTNADLIRYAIKNNLVG